VALADISQGLCLVNISMEVCLAGVRIARHYMRKGVIGDGLGNLLVVWGVGRLAISRRRDCIAIT
jgi:hypothetical protein